MSSSGDSQEPKAQGLERWSAVKGTGCSFRFKSQHLHSSSQLSLTPVQGSDTLMLAKHQCISKKQEAKNQGLLGMVVHNFNPSTQEAEAGRSLSLRFTGLHREFQVSQGWVRETHSQKQSNKNPSLWPRETAHKPWVPSLTLEKQGMCPNKALHYEGIKKSPALQYSQHATNWRFLC